jgi:diacylglycerol kinase (ATP)
MRVHVIANPTAGRGRTPRLLAAVEAALVARGAIVTTFLTAKAGDATTHVGTLAPSSIDRLVIIGGDGTLHEAVNGRPAPLPWPVAIVPVGTANLVARDVGMPLHSNAAAYADVILDGEPWTVDLLDTDCGRALAVCGAGLDAEVVHAVASARRSGLGGYARWMFPIAKTFIEYSPPQLEVELDGRRVACEAAIVQNTRCYGGLFTLSPTARMDDGRLDVVVFLEARRRDHFRLLTTAYIGRLAHDRGVRILTGTSVAIRSVRSARPVAMQIDGDPAGTTPFTARILPRALTLLRPRR